MKNYTIKNRLLTALAVMIVLGDIALGVLVWKKEDETRKNAWENSIPMANQCITWSGAGYQQIGGGVND